MTPPLDRERLLADLDRAIEAAGFGSNMANVDRAHELDGMRRAWKVTAASIRDGDYDVGPPTEEELEDRVTEILTAMYWPPEEDTR